ncbi:MAG: fumarylacetoacetate hydrolase family protein [Acetobacteraceae bacterium]|nr:fumarylacetoacetate hydrolase family protein [Acetobacteraceae bacterium]
MRRWPPTELGPGDVPVTGTPGGGPALSASRFWRKAGNTIEVEISGIGILHNAV